MIFTYTNTRVCSRCRKIKSIEEFYKRQDRGTPYSWCIQCMEKNNRSIAFPEYEDRGYGTISPNMDSQIID